MYALEHAVTALSTRRSPWLNGGLAGENKPMVSRPSTPTARERIEFLLAQTGTPGTTALARWAEIKAPQNITAAMTRDSISRDLGVKICKVSHASLDWLLADIGVPFPNGPARYTGEVPKSAEPRLRQTEARLDATFELVLLLLRQVSAKLSDADKELVPAIRKLGEENPSLQPILEVAARAAAAIPESKEPAAPRVRRGVSPGKPPRKDR